MTQIHTPPELTPHGAQLLADALAERQTGARASSAPTEKSSPLLGLPVILGLALGSIILGSAAVWIALDDPVAVEVRGAVEVASTSVPPADRTQLVATVEDLSPQNGTVRTFSLRIAVGELVSGIAVDQIVVTVENSQGVPVTTIVRFDQGTLRSHSSVVANVRAEGLDSRGSSVVVQLDDVEIKRMSLD